MLSHLLVSSTPLGCAGERPAVDLKKMNSFNKGVLYFGAIAMALSTSAVAQQLFTNTSYEQGTYPTSGSGTTPITFAGQQAHSLANTGSGATTTGWSITGWSFSSGNNGNSERWMQDIDDTRRAQSGDRYAYLSTTVTSGAGNACILYTGSTLNFTQGYTYRFSFFAANAGSTATSGSSLPRIGFEVQGGGGPDVLQTVTLPANAAWSDGAESVIPWVQYTLDWIPTQNYSNPSFYWSSFAGSGANAVGNVVLDNVSLTQVAVPEAHTVAAGIFMAGAVGATLYRRRKAQA
jgi:hypothetical protein